MKNILPGLIALLAFSGCFATQRDILDLSEQNDNITLQVHNLKKLIGTIQANQADLNDKLGALHRDVLSLNENLKDNRDSMSRLSAKMDDLGAVVGGKVASIDKSMAEKLAQEAAERRKIEEKQKTIEQQVKKTAEEEAARREAAQKAAEGPTPSEIYHQARTQLSQGKHDMAAQGFGVYLQKYPKGELADFAAYYLGDALSAQEKWEPAARQYAFVLDKHPNSELTPAARLRYATCLIKLKMPEKEARQYLESIPQDFPGSPEAKRAAELLKTLDPKKAAPAKAGQAATRK